MGGKRLVVVMTCHNRKETTLECLRRLKRQEIGNELSISAYIVDDGSVDGTYEAVKKYWPDSRLFLGNGELFWNGGMYLAFEKAMEECYDYYLWLNDDTFLFDDAISRLVNISSEALKCNGEKGIVVGSVLDKVGGKVSYGGVVRKSWLRRLHFKVLEPSNIPIECDTMNGNCVLIPDEVVRVVGNLDPFFIHNNGDFDYGLRAKKAHFSIWVAPGYFGVCCRNSIVQTCLDKNLSPFSRLKKMLDYKGLPIKQRKVYTQRHGGTFWPIYWVYPYLKVLIPSVSFMRNIWRKFLRKSA